MINFGKKTPSNLTLEEMYRRIAETEAKESIRKVIETAKHHEIAASSLNEFIATVVDYTMGRVRERLIKGGLEENIRNEGTAVLSTAREATGEDLDITRPIRREDVTAREIQGQYTLVEPGKETPLGADGTFERPDRD